MQSKCVHSGFSFIILMPVSQDCPRHKGSHSSIASLLTLCLSMHLWDGRWVVIRGQSVFMWTVIWHLLDMQRGSYLTALAKYGTRYEVVSTKSAWGLPWTWKSVYFAVCCVRSGKLPEIISSAAGSNVSTLLVTSWPMVLTGEVAEAMLLTLRKVCHSAGLGAKLKGSRASLSKWKLSSSNNEQGTLVHQWQSNYKLFSDHV